MNSWNKHVLNLEVSLHCSDAALFTSVVQPDWHEVTNIPSGNETDTADGKDVDVNPLLEPLSLLFVIWSFLMIVNENKVDI